ncbi:MAG: anaerobic ribonucleoside-triphosphate reductase activating protein [Oscillospiraceae bacterium]|nr:anaerobic ribonucleoside-triphosphate reductase activating protein [Oscillospiraceae bacterium]
MNYAELKSYDIANGPGVRVSLFVSGCTHRCKGCFNQEAWDFDYGKPFDETVMDQILDLLKPGYIKGITYLGGEPLDPRNQEGLSILSKKIKEAYPEKTIWCFTGYVLEQDILTGRLGPLTEELLGHCDVLVDGPFIEAQKNLSLKFRGSENQRLLDIKQSLAKRAPVLWEGSL